MKALKIIAIVLGIYAGIVVLFESLLGYYQPASQQTLTITTSDASGSHDRVLARIESNGTLYVAANHWPRQWYHRALENPAVGITFQGETARYTAAPISGEEHDRVNGEHALALPFRFLTGFPPRYLLRLDPA